MMSTTYDRPVDSRFFGALFNLGTILTTPAAQAAIESADETLGGLLWRHATGDYGDTPADDAEINNASLKQPNPWILSTYRLSDGTKIFVHTLGTPDERTTTAMLASEY